MKKQPDQKTSWEESFDIGSQVTSEDTYWKESAGSWVMKNWTSLWVDGNDSDKAAPDLLIYKPEMSYTIKAYSSKLYLYRIQSNIGKVNSNKFMEDYFKFDQDSGIESDIPANYDDEECWLFMSCPLRRTRYDCWEYRFTFLLCPRIEYDETWNTPYGINANIYATFNFNTLLNGMRATDTMGAPRA